MWSRGPAEAKRPSQGALMPAAALSSITSLLLDHEQWDGRQAGVVRLGRDANPSEVPGDEETASTTNLIRAAMVHAAKSVKGRRGFFGNSAAVVEPLRHF